MKDMTMSFAEEISALEPFGIGNATPAFVMKDVKVKKISAIGGGKHTRLTLEKDGEVATALYFGINECELGFTVGDPVDVLFNLDINDYKNIKSVQMVLQDARMAKSYTDEEDRQKKRYSELSEGGECSVSEDFIPSRDDCAAVYKTLRKMYRHETSVIDIRTLLKLIAASGDDLSVNYVKLKYILRIFNELRICEAEEIDTELYKFDIFFNASKTSIDKSSILKKLKSQCRDRHNAD
jgi:single-stranded-DNA-specific exonuclease